MNTSTTTSGLVIAIDGPAASGKSSTARAVAGRLGYRHLDSGSFYRALTLAALQRGIPVDRWPLLTHEELDSLHVDAVPADGSFLVRVDGQDVSEAIRGADVNAHVSLMAAVPAVRGWLLEILRETGRNGGLVADGRDIGTVVFPDADLKIFLISDPEVRARRRLLQQGAHPDGETLRQETERLAARDHLDQTRSIAPLVPAADAITLDTSDLSFEEQVSAVVELSRVREP
ncbi:MAG: (d)CMP kinase [Gemmatimonadota bacterium]|jgi:cytidylate kinase|nr:(d)CMP kinase [Gemmatimonadota bacterium]